VSADDAVPTLRGGDYDAMYRDTSEAGRPPWEIGEPQPALAAVLDEELPGQRVLDIGCGSGELAIALARRGYEVTGIDFSPVAIDLARAKAADAGLAVRFEVGDATRLPAPAIPYDAVFDSGLLHSLHRNGGNAAGAYLTLLPRLITPGGVLFVLAVSVAAGYDWTLTEDSLRADFVDPAWADTRIDEIGVHAQSGGQQLLLPGFLLRTVRTETA
jgi:SAM-dependent methyltransferase